MKDVEYPAPDKLVKFLSKRAARKLFFLDLQDFSKSSLNGLNKWKTYFLTSLKNYMHYIKEKC